VKSGCGGQKARGGGLMGKGEEMDNSSHIQIMSKSYKYK